MTRVEPSTRSLQSIVVEDLSHRYADASANTFQGIDFSIESGEIVVCVGPSGSGKSTLADVILGLQVPASGSVRVDGQDIQSKLADWWGQAAYVPQEPGILDDSLRRNVAYGVADDQIEDGRVQDALDAVGLASLIADRGLDGEVGEGGARLSGGQRQRLALARALYHDRQFIVLDEATSELDPQAEAEIAEVLSRLAGQKTFFVIAHRSCLEDNADRLIRLDRGQATVEIRNGPVPRIGHG